MPFTRTALALVWLTVLGLFVLSASGTIVGNKGVLWLVLGALATPAIIFTAAATLWRSAATTAPFDARALAASDAHDLLRMDSDKG